MTSAYVLNKVEASYTNDLKPMIENYRQQAYDRLQALIAQLRSARTPLCRGSEGHRKRGQPNRLTPPALHLLKSYPPPPSPYGTFLPEDRPHPSPSDHSNRPLMPVLSVIEHHPWRISVATGPSPVFNNSAS